MDDNGDDDDKNNMFGKLSRFDRNPERTPEQRYLSAIGITRCGDRCRIRARGCSENRRVGIGANIQCTKITAQCCCTIYICYNIIVYNIYTVVPMPPLAAKTIHLCPFSGLLRAVLVFVTYITS